jgi:hypothetical protein
MDILLGCAAREDSRGRSSREAIMGKTEVGRILYCNKSYQFLCGRGCNLARSFWKTLSERYKDE